MIPYQRSAFGINLLFRIHGSATYRGIIPGLLAVAFLAFYRALFEGENHDDMQISHPYAVGVIVSGITFLIVFRASQGYSRYWEATSACYSMMSKWMDATVHTASYHMQNDHYNHIKPPSFHDYPHLDSLFLTRDRERLRDSDKGTRGIMNRKRVVARSINQISDENLQSNGTPQRNLSESQRHQSSRHFVTAESVRHLSGQIETDTGNPGFLTGKARLDGNWGGRFSYSTGNARTTATFFDPVTNSIPRDRMGFASTVGGRTPPLFLQELAHLSSLLVAVAFATLRNDIEGAESPLDYYEAGEPWPEEDPGDMPELHASGRHRLWATLLYFLGRGRTPEERTRYNAKRPLPVIGGVSDAEIRLLQVARGPYAKTQLCWHWLSEFITREHLAGSLGEVGPPIISRIIQFLGDGMVFYNQGRKVMGIPFPFVHAQLSAIFVMVMIVLIPFLMENYCPEFWTAAILTFLSVVCLAGIHEVARELENPFRNVPNELPVVTMMAEYNEALFTMYAGYHPDFFWDPHIQGLNASPTGSNVRSIDIEQSRQPNIDDSIGSSFGGSPGAKSGISHTPIGATLGVVDEGIDRDSSHTHIDAGTMMETCGENTHLADVMSPTNEGAKMPAPDTSELDELRAIVAEQGRIMIHMLEEQARLNKMVEASINRKKKQ